MEELVKLLGRNLKPAEEKLFNDYKSNKKYIFKKDYDGDLIVVDKEIQERLNRGETWEQVKHLLYASN